MKIMKIQKFVIDVKILNWYSGSPVLLNLLIGHCLRKEYTSVKKFIKLILMKQQ